MILKTPEGHYVEITGKEYTQFVAEILVHFNKANKLALTFVRDARIDAARLLIETVASNKYSMTKELQDDYFKTAHEILDRYNKDNLTTNE